MFTEEERAKWKALVEHWRNGEKVFDAGRRVEQTDNTSVQKQEPV
jgi:macrodomain Ter protein organizer (MatP/YcbG family)